MDDLDIPYGDLASFDLHHQDGSLPFGDINSILSLPAPTKQPISPDTIVASKVHPTGASFNPTEELVPWRNFHVAPLSRAILESLLTRYPQILDRFDVRTDFFQTMLLDRLANLIPQMRQLSIQSLQAKDLAYLNYQVEDLSSFSIDMSPFRSRLDLITDTYRAIGLHSRIASRCQERENLSKTLLDANDTLEKLKARVQEFELAIQDIERRILAATKDHDNATADLEALSLPPVQFDTSWPLDHDFL